MNQKSQLLSAFEINDTPQLIAIVGGGGKTSLMFALAAALPGRVVVTTTTRIFAAQMQLAPVVCLADNLTSLPDKLAQWRICLVVGKVMGDKAVGVAPTLPSHLLARPDVDFVLVEADGSRMRPVKAPAEHEPMIPLGTTLVVPVVGIDALNDRIDKVAHRPKRVSTLTSLPETAVLTPAAIATLLTHAQGGLKGVPSPAHVIPFINKIETTTQLAAARQIAKVTLTESRIARVVLGAVRTDRPVWEVQQRVTAVVLAAGQAKRMGRAKQLLPWGERTVLGQTLYHLKKVNVHDVMVVTGHEAAAVTTIATAAGVMAVHNPDYATGEMLSSLQVAVRGLDEGVTAVLVVLADQPMILPETMNKLLTAYWRGASDLIAPVYKSRRGNPVLIGRAYFEALLALPVGTAPRALLQRYVDKLHLVAVGTNTILQDLDTVTDYERLRP